MKKIFYILLITHCTLLIVNSQPTQEWVRRWPDNSPVPSGSLSIKQDSLGFVYVLADTGNGFGFIKYDQSGNLLLHSTYKPGGYSWGGGRYFDVTQSGDVYITGSFGIDINEWIYTVKFNSNGLFQWGRLYNQDNVDGVEDLKVDKARNIIVVGGSVVGSTNYALTIKYNSNGDTLWTRHFNNNQNYAVNSRIALDDSNNIYLTGDIGPTPNKCLVLKYNPAGNLKWFTTFTLDPARSNGGKGIAVDNNRNIYVLGTQIVPQYNFSDYLLKLNNEGIILWNSVFTGIIPGQIGTNDGYPIGPIISKDGDAIYYSQRTRNNNGAYYSIATLKYNSLGDSEWVRVYSGGNIPGTSNFTGNITLDKNGSVYICGSGYYQTTGDDFVTIKYTSLGVQQWVARYTGLVTNGGDGASDLYIDTSLNMFVTGQSRKTINSYYDAVTIKYNQPMGIISNNNKLPREYKLHQNYPNPFNSKTVINFEIPIRSYVELKLFNSNGQMVKTIVQGEQNASYYTIYLDMENLSSGVYFYQLIADGNIIDTKKLVILK